MEFAEDVKTLRRGPKIEIPALIGAVIDLGLCLDLTTSAGVQHVRSAHHQLVQIANKAGYELPKNSPDLLRRNLDCAVITLLHDIREEADDAPIDTVRGIFLEGAPIYEGSGFFEKTHIQICVCNPECIKGVFRVPKHQMA